jgi:hypothetical protein
VRQVLRQEPERLNDQKARSYRGWEPIEARGCAAGSDTGVLEAK